MGSQGVSMRSWGWGAKRWSKWGYPLETPFLALFRALRGQKVSKHDMGLGPQEAHMGHVGFTQPAILLMDAKGVKYGGHFWTPNMTLFKPKSMSWI